MRRRILGNRRVGVLTAFISTWKTDNTITNSSNSNQVNLNLVSNSELNVLIEWGDGTTTHLTETNYSEKLHTYSEIGTYQIKITGVFKYGNNISNFYYDRNKLLSIEQWGDFDTNDTYRLFNSYVNLNLEFVTDVLNTSMFTNFSGMFQGSTNLKKVNRINEWDTSQAILMSSMFHNCHQFDQPISFNTSNVTTMDSMFNACRKLNSAINIDTGNVIEMAFMFDRAYIFDQPLNFNTSKVASMNYMFRNPTVMKDISIANWNITSITNLTEFMSARSAASFPATTYDAILNNWSAQTVKPNVTFSMGSIKYTSAGAAARAILTGSPNNWSITDGGQI